MSRLCTGRAKGINVGIPVVHVGVSTHAEVAIDLEGQCSTVGVHHLYFELVLGLILCERNLNYGDDGHVRQNLREKREP